MANSTDLIRNVAIAGHGGTGKTTLLEHLLFQGGAIPKPETIDHSRDDGLPVHAHIHEHQPVAYHAEKQGAEHRSDNRSLAAREAGAADNGRRYRVHVEIEPRVRVAGADPADHHDTRDAGQKARQTEYHDRSIDLPPVAQLCRWRLLP